MERIKSIWLLLSTDAVLCCNESSQPSNIVSDLMSLELFTKIISLAKEKSWACTVLGNKNEIPGAYRKFCQETNVTVILPANYKGSIPGKHTVIVFEPGQTESAAKYSSVSQAILRIRRDDLPKLSQMVLALLDRFTDISIKHPELLSYNDEDMITYKNQLLEISMELLGKKESWCNYRVDCLTDRFQSDDIVECGAGVAKIAVGPTGELYLCPAAARNAESPCGHILGDVEIPNRHLLTREYSVLCDKCDALHCRRCVYLNRCSTFEFCVPSRNMCRLAHFELEIQAWLAQEAIKKNLWDESSNIPASPAIYDPYELVKAEKSPPIAHSWRRLVTFEGHPENLQPSMMLDIIHHLQGWYDALTTCAQAGLAPAVQLMESDKLASLRRRTIEQYRDVIFQEGCPTVRQIELLMCKAVQENSSPS